MSGLIVTSKSWGVISECVRGELVDSLLVFLYTMIILAETTRMMTIISDMYSMFLCCMGLSCTYFPMEQSTSEIFGPFLDEQSNPLRVNITPEGMLMIVSLNRKLVVFTLL